MSTGPDRANQPGTRPQQHAVRLTDPFESALNLEESHINEGHEAGVTAGRRAGRAEGRALGLRKGFEVGSELGYYSGCCQVWRQLAAAQPGFMPQRADKAVAALERLIADFPLGDPQDERLQELMAAIQGRYKAATAMLGLQDAHSQEHSANDGGGAGGLQF